MYINSTQEAYNEKREPQSLWIPVHTIANLKERDSDKMAAMWDLRHGEGNWQIMWQSADSEMLDFKELFDMYTAGYAAYFIKHLSEADELTMKHKYSYADYLITESQAFDIDTVLREKPPHFHHIALNVALVHVLGFPFQGKDPIQIKAEKPVLNFEGILKESAKLNPAYISIPEYYPKAPQNSILEDIWWQKGSLLDFYKRAKVLAVKKSAISSIPSSRILN